VNNIIIILQKQQSTGGINQQGKQLAGQNFKNHGTATTKHII